MTRRISGQPVLSTSKIKSRVKWFSLIEGSQWGELAATVRTVVKTTSKLKPKMRRVPI
jgi:hypothetical protein